MLTLNRKDEENLEKVIAQIKEKGHDKLHSNRGSMSNRISVSIFDALKDKSDYSKKLDLIINSMSK